MSDASKLAEKLRELGLPEDDVASACEAHAEGDPSALLRMLLLRLMWSEVAPEGEDADGTPRWATDWLRLGQNGFPFIDAPALGRLADSGADLVAVRDVVRSAQVLMLYNLANILDDGWRHIETLLGRELAQGLHWELSAANVRDGSRGPVIGGLHECMGDHDPTGRGGDPQSTEG